VQNSEFRQVVAAALDDLKAVDIVVLNVAGVTSITDYMVIASGTSDRHVRSIADRVLDKARQAGQTVLGVEGHEYGEWVLVDLGDIVLHIMQPRVRDYYKLENLWNIDTRARQPTDAGQAG
jgi:ribosome-associated protein